MAFNHWVPGSSPGRITILIAVSCRRKRRAEGPAFLRECNMGAASHGPPQTSLQTFQTVPGLQVEVARRFGLIENLQDAESPDTPRRLKFDRGSEPMAEHCSR